MSNAVAKTEKTLSPIATVGAALEKMKPQLQAVLPKHITPERLARVALVAIQNTPKLLECDRQSLYLAILRSAQLGLEPDGILGQAYLIPYGKQVQFIPGYKGLIDLARRSGEVTNIIAKEVCENDEFEVDYALEIPFKHKPLLKGDRGEVTHFWALAKFKDGGFHWDYMTREEVEAIRDRSSGWQSAKKYNKTKDSPWEAHFVEMGKKTAIRRIAKYLPMSVQRAASFEALQDEGHKVNFADGDLIIEGTGKTITDDGQDKEPSKLDSFADDKLVNVSDAAKESLKNLEAKAADSKELSEEEMNAIDAAEAAAQMEEDNRHGFLKGAAQ